MPEKHNGSRKQQPPQPPRAVLQEKMAHDIAPEEGFDNQELHYQPEETYNPAVDIVIDYPLPGFEELFEGLQEVTSESSEVSAAVEPQLNTLEVAVMSPNIDCFSNVCLTVLNAHHGYV